MGPCRIFTIKRMCKILRLVIACPCLLGIRRAGPSFAFLLGKVCTVCQRTIQNLARDLSESYIYVHNCDDLSTNIIAVITTAVVTVTVTVTLSYLLHCYVKTVFLAGSLDRPSESCSCSGP